MNEVLNCPNCGAPITGPICEYCGTVLYDFANIDAEGTSYIRLKVNGQLFVFRAKVTSVEFRTVNDEVTFYADNRSFCTFNPANHEVDVSFSIVPDDKGVLMMKAKRERREE